MTHRPLLRLTDDELASEVLDARAVLEGYGLSLRTGAYPPGDHGEQVPQLRGSCSYHRVEPDWLDPALPSRTRSRGWKSCAATVLESGH